MSDPVKLFLRPWAPGLVSRWNSGRSGNKRAA